MKSHKIGNSKGFSLLEALVVGVLLFISIVGIMQMYFVTFYNAPKVENLTKANYILNKEAETVLSQSFTLLDNFLQANYPKVVKDGYITYTITYSIVSSFTWGKYIEIMVNWKEGQESKSLSIELFKAKL